MTGARVRELRPGRGAVLAAVLVVALVAAGCAGDPGRSTDASEDLAMGLVEGTTEEQRSVLRDFEVSDGEYAGAYDDVASCLSEGGWEGARVERDATGIAWHLRVEPSEDEQGDVSLGDVRDAERECRAVYLSDVEAVYLAQQVRDERAFPRLKEELVACLERHGVDGVGAGTPEGEIAGALVEAEAPVPAWVCLETYLLRTGRVGTVE